MNGMKCIVIDPDKKSRRHLLSALNGMEQFTVLEDYSNFSEASEELKRHKAEVVFFDAECLKRNEADFVSHLRKIHAHLIMTAVKKEDALEAFNLEAVDFILKPVSKLRLARTLARVMKQHTRVQKKKNNSKELFLRFGNHFLKVSLKDVYLISRASPETLYIHTRQENYLVPGTLNQVIKMLPENEFIRVHKSFIVRIAGIEKIEEDWLRIENQTIPIGQKQKDLVLEKLQLA
jgi:DNA-binding LytR/AlgR family response regulator